MPPENCPNCGADVPRDAKACPGCGSDEHTGWSEIAYASGLNLPEEEFDHARFVEEEFDATPARPRGIHWLWWFIALLLTLSFLGFLFH